MMIDASAILAIAWDEPEAERMARAIVDDPIRLMSAVSCLEALMVAEGRHGPVGGRELQGLFTSFAIETISFDPHQLRLAQSAFLRFGKGRHPAALNLGDCCAYAAAVARGEPLLFKGRDFALTDIEAVAW